MRLFGADEANWWWLFSRVFKSTKIEETNAQADTGHGLALARSACCQSRICNKTPLHFIDLSRRPPASAGWLASVKKPKPKVRARMFLSSQCGHRHHHHYARVSLAAREL